MEGSWGRGMAFGVNGIARAADGSALRKRVTLAAGRYRVYVRAVTSLTQRATYRITVGNQELLTPAYANTDLRVGWIYGGQVDVDEGEADIRVEDGPKDGAEVLDAIALASDDFSDEAGRALALNQYILREVERAAAPLRPPVSAADAIRRQHEMRSRLLRAMGLETMPPRTPLNPVITGRLQRDGYVIEKVAFESRPGHVVPGLLYIPQNTKFPAPAVVNLIGHWNAGKSSFVPQRRVIGLAKRGYIAFSIDPSYAWERRIPGNSEGSDPYVSGASINGHQAWDTMRAVDYLLTRPEVDPQRLAVTGASGGGQQTLYAGAIDERFKVVAPAVYVWAFNDITAHWGYSSDNWLPGALLNGDMAATLAITAPRALLVLAVTKDYVNVEGSISQVNQARPFYRALNAEDDIRITVHPGEHDFNQPMREAFYGLLDLWLKGQGDGRPQPEPELDILPETSKELLVFEGGKIPAANAATVRSIWTEEAIRLRDRLPASNPNIPALLEREILRLPPARAPEVRHLRDGRLLIGTEAGIKIPAVSMGSGKRAVIWIAANLATNAAAETVQALGRDSTVLIVEPRGMGLGADRQLANQGAILLGRPLPGMWTYDVLRAVDYLRDQRGFQSISVIGKGRYPALVALLAAVLDRRIEHATVDGLFDSFVEIVGRDPIAELFGILRVADISHLVASAGSARITWRKNATP